MKGTLRGRRSWEIVNMRKENFFKMFLRIEVVLYSYFKYKQGSSSVNHPLFMVSAHKKSKLKEKQ